jgi:putative ABC transport system permease protein
MGATPVLLAAGLAAGAVAALGLTLTASVRRRRRDLALLKALGFTRRQLAACVAWQPTVAAALPGRYAARTPTALVLRTE